MRLNTRRLLLLIAAGYTIFASFAAAQNSDPDKPDAGSKINVACVGDSITRGAGAKGNSYPKQLQAMLGDEWHVMNFGNSGSTLMNSGNKPYQKTGDYKKAIASNPDVVVIMLGTNDTKPQNWKNFEQDYEKDYRDLIADFADLDSKPRIFLCLPPYIAGEGNWGINEPNTKEQIPVIKSIAKDLDLGLIDVHSALKDKDDLIPDRVHPNAEGAKLIAKAVHDVLSREITSE